MPAVKSASDWMRRSRSWYEALRRAKYSTTAKTARLRISAVAYHRVSRPRMLSMSGPHDVAHAAHRVDQFGLAAVIDLLAQARDDHVDDVRARIEVVVPRVLGDQRPRHHASLMAHQVFEHGVLFGRELDRSATPRHRAAARVEGEVGHLEHRRRDRLGAAAQGFHARQQLLERERLRHVIIGTHAQRLYFEIHGVLRGEDEHRQAVPPISQRAQHLDPGQLGEAEVQHEQVEVAAGGETQPLIAVAHELRVVPGLVEPAAHILADCFVVLDDQDFHATGRYTLKLLPTPTCDSTSMRPRCSSKMPYATERPSPVPLPCGLVVKNGSKILERSSGEIPVPVSMNSIRSSSARCGFGPVRTVSRPRAFMASRALSIKAMKH